MARQVSTTTQTIEREIGDACPRECPGTLRMPKDVSVTNKRLLECGTCRRLFPGTYSIPMAEEDKEGTVQALYLPDDIVRAYIEAAHARDLAAALPNPADRKEANSNWFEEDINDELRAGWEKDARDVLEPIWPMIAEWFGGVPSFSAAMRQRDAVRAIEEIALPSLKYCEEKYGHDDQARLNLEASIKERT